MCSPRWYLCVLSLSPVLHSSGMHWPFLSLCSVSQRRQWSAAVQKLQLPGQDSHRFRAEGKDPSGQISRHWPWNRYLASPNWSRCSRRRRGNLHRRDKNSGSKRWCTKQAWRHIPTHTVKHRLLYLYLIIYEGRHLQQEIFTTGCSTASSTMLEQTDIGWAHSYISLHTNVNCTFLSYSDKMAITKW